MMGSRSSVTPRGWTARAYRTFGRLARSGPGSIALLTAGPAAVALGVFLLVRPLTSLLVLAGALVVAFLVGALAASGVRAASGARAAGRRPRPAPLRIAAAAAAVIAVVIAVEPSEAIAALPAVLAVVLAANAVRLLISLRMRSTPGQRVVRAAGAVSSALFAWLSWAWPDLASIALAVGFAATMIVTGAAAITAAVRARLARARPTRPVASDGQDPRAAGHRRAAGRGRRILRATGAVTLLAVGVTATWGTVQVRAGVAAATDFYAWTTPLDPEMPPGSVLRTAPYAGEVPAGAEALRVLYTTTYADGTPAVASAVVAYPRDPSPDPATVLAWQHGTTGVAQACGPSLGDAALTEYAIPGISRAIARGWVVVATDYPGQGTGGKYPYLIGEGEGRATLDGVRAAGRLDGIRTSGHAWLWGHSQGGHATLWAGQIADDYAPEIEVDGVAALSAASDPLALAERITGAGASALADAVTSYVLVPYADEYPDVRLDDTVHPAGHGIVETFATRCATDLTTLASLLTGRALAADAPLYRIDLDSGPAHDRLVENIADGLVPAPLFLGQGVDDEVVPIDMQRELDARLCAAGRTVQTHEYPGRSHMGVVAEGSPLIDDLYAWADTVAAGGRPDSCSG